VIKEMAVTLLFCAILMVYGQTADINQSNGLFAFTDCEALRWPFEPDDPDSEYGYQFEIACDDPRWAYQNLATQDPPGLWCNGSNITGIDVRNQKCSRIEGDPPGVDTWGKIGDLFALQYLNASQQCPF
jgi:hypothetical protein